ncbi:MAG: site-specific DNA-methyltransferase [Hyphomicrobiaceae bacterium]|nr:site-specific DNA-methyltransferase [Hyphomicrobiaceae bacterium]
MTAKKPGRGRKKSKSVRAFDQSDLEGNSTGNSDPHPRKKAIQHATKGARKKDVIDSYNHVQQTRPNNLESGLFSEFKRDDKQITYKFDHRDHPVLVWSSKEERTEICEYAVPLCTHEKIDPVSIINQITKKDLQDQTQMTNFFSENKLPFHNAIDFYRHENNWANRLIVGDSLLMMISLIENEGMNESVDMIYFDPPYGIGYNSNFQISTRRSEQSSDKDVHLSKDPESIKAYNDTWNSGVHSYLSYMRDRLTLSKLLLKPDGSIFVQISDKYVHHIRELMDEVFGPDNFHRQIYFQKTSPTRNVDAVFDTILWYAKDLKISRSKFNIIYRTKEQHEIDKTYKLLDIGDQLVTANLENMEKYPNGKRCYLDNMTSQGENKARSHPYVFRGKRYYPGKGRHWSRSKEVMDVLASKNRLKGRGNTLYFKKYYDDFPFTYFSNVWTDTIINKRDIAERLYVVQTSTKPVERCMLMCTSPGDLVLDPSCGSGTTAFVAEKLGRRWITVDTSQVAIQMARARIMCSKFDYYKLRNQDCIADGFEYEVHKNITRSYLGEDLDGDGGPAETILYDQPKRINQKIRVTGPFTVESVYPPTVASIDWTYDQLHPEDAKYRGSILGRHYQDNWRMALSRVGVTGRGRIEFASLEPHSNTEFIHAIGETKDGKSAMVSFGPGYGTMDLRQVEKARKEASRLGRDFDMMIFIALQFDPSIGQEIAALNGMKSLRTEFYMVDASKDLMLYDLKRPSSEKSASFRMMGQPEIEIKKSGDEYMVSVVGFDYMDPKSGELKSGDDSDIAMWMLDTDYDDRSLYPRQVFFPADGGSMQEIYLKMTGSLKAVIDEDLMQAYKSSTSLPFKAGEHRTVAVKIIDNAGRETMKVEKLP